MAFLPLPLPRRLAARRGCREGPGPAAERGGRPAGRRPPGRGPLGLSTTTETLDAPGARLLRWSYLNYLLHVAASQAVGQAPQRFAWFAHSPLPTPRTQGLVIAGLLVGWLLFCCCIAWRVGAEPGSLRPRGSSCRQWLMPAGSATATGTPRATTRLKVASCRLRDPLAGLLTLLANMLVLIGPYFALQSVLARRVQPFPEADGLWRTTTDALYILWMTFDLGTQTAFVKYFAEHRANPSPACRAGAFRRAVLHLVSDVLAAHRSLAARRAGPGLPAAFELRHLRAVCAALRWHLAAGFPGRRQVSVSGDAALYYNLLDFLESRC